ncbi:hypothetical protein SNEBB_001809 [Seison nebaliae]|nr:hypothetical protein SNEBB_001809 [Seison nebaliae]
MEHNEETKRQREYLRWKSQEEMKLRRKEHRLRVLKYYQLRASTSTVSTTTTFAENTPLETTPPPVLNISPVVQYNPFDRCKHCRYINQLPMNDQILLRKMKALNDILHHLNIKNISEYNYNLEYNRETRKYNSKYMLRTVRLPSYIQEQIDEVNKNDFVEMKQLGEKNIANLEKRIRLSRFRKDTPITRQYIEPQKNFFCIGRSSLCIYFPKNLNRMKGIKYLTLKTALLLPMNKTLCNTEPTLIFYPMPNNKSENLYKTDQPVVFDTQPMGNWTRIPLITLKSTTDHSARWNFEDNRGITIRRAGCNNKRMNELFPISKQSPLFEYIVMKIQLNNVNEKKERKQRSNSITDEKENELPQCLSEAKKMNIDIISNKQCCLRYVTLDFSSFGWHWIIYPKTFKLTFCDGYCGALTHINQKVSGFSKCSAMSKAPLVIVYRDEKNRKLLKTIQIPELRATSCHCM